MHGSVRTWGRDSSALLDCTKGFQSIKNLLIAPTYLKWPQLLITAIEQKTDHAKISCVPKMYLNRAN